MFYTLTENKETDDQKLVVDNLDASSDHWGAVRNITRIADDLELILYGKSDFAAVENKLIQTFLAICKQSPRIGECRFYKDNENKNALICLCISDVTTFKPENFLKRNISIEFKKQNKLILISDVTQEEWKKVGVDLALPKTWELDEVLTKKYNKYKQLFI